MSSLVKVKKTKSFADTRFPVSTLKRASAVLQDMAGEVNGGETESCGRSVRQGDVGWTFDTDDEFLAEYRNGGTGSYGARVRYFDPEAGPGEICGPFTHASLWVEVEPWVTRVDVDGPDRATIERIMAPFDEDAEGAYRPPLVYEAPHPDPVVFIGHGHSAQWRDLKDHLCDKHGYRVEAYEVGARAGHHIRDILEDMLTGSSFAIMLMTGDDDTHDGRLHARPNVIHETGLFQGKLGFSRVAVLVENNVDLLSNLDGVQRIEYAPGNIKETFGEVLATLRREFPPRTVAVRQEANRTSL